jgi:hypothetical protein
MSGKRHHFIPPFLQEGFASHTSGGNTFTWIYRREGAAFNANIIDVGVEGQFDTENQDTEADDFITLAEGTFSGLIADLRAGKSSRLSDPLLPQLIANLEIRTRNLRENVLRAGEFLICNFPDWMSDEEAFSDFLTRKFQSNPSFIHDAVLKTAADRQLTPQESAALTLFFKALVPILIEWQKPDFARFAAALRSALPKTPEEAVKSRHVETSKASIAPGLRLELYESLTYTIGHATEESLILGDSVILFCVDGATRYYKAFLDGEDELNSVILPLDSGKCLVGTRNAFTGVPRGLRDTIARCSLEHFVSHEKSSANELLKVQIGADAALLSKAKLERILTEVIQS